MLAHEISAWSTVHSTDLTKMLFNQIGARSTILGVPNGLGIVGLLVVVGTRLK